MSKQVAKKIIRERYGIIVRGRCQVNFHGCGEYSICWGEDKERRDHFAHSQHFNA